MNWIVLLVLLARLGLSDAADAMVLTDGLPSTYGGAFKFENGRFVAVLNYIYQLSELFVVKDGEIRFTIELVGEPSLELIWNINFRMLNGQTRKLCIQNDESLVVTIFCGDTNGISDVRYLRDGIRYLNVIMSPDGVFKSINGQTIFEALPGIMKIGMPDKPTYPGMYGFTMSFDPDPRILIKVHFDPGYVATTNYV